MISVVALLFAVSIADTRGGSVEEILYSGGVLDALYMTGPNDESIRDDAPIEISVRGTAASKVFLMSVTGGLPSTSDPVKNGLVYMGILTVRGSDFEGTYYTDGEYLCTVTAHCKPVGATFRGFIDPTYVEDEAVLRVFSER